MSASLPGEDDTDLPSPSAGLKDQIRSIMQHDGYVSLLAELARGDSSVGRLLLRHPEDIFPKLDPENMVIPEEFPLSVPLLFWENPVEPVADATVRPSVVEVLGQNESVQRGTEDQEEIQLLVEGDDSNDTDNFGELILLNALRVLQHNPHLLALVQQEENISLPQVRKALGQHPIDLKPLEDEGLQLMEDIAEEQGLGTLFRSLLRRSETDTETVYEAKKMMNELYRVLNDFLPELPKLAGELHRLFPDLATRGAPFLRQHNAFVHRVYGSSSEDHLRALDKLWELGMLRPLFVVLTCVSCRDEEGNPLRQTLSSDLPPSRLAQNPACSWCGEPASVQTMYGVDVWVYRWIVSQDGLLSYVVAYLLEANQTEWRDRVPTATSEHDFHVQTPHGIHVLECKVFRRSAAFEQDRSLREKVKKALAQLRDHVAEVDAISGTLVCHPYHPQFKSQQVEAEGLRLDIVGVEDVPRLVSRLRQDTYGG